MTDILDVFMNGPTVMSLEEVAAAAGLPQSTAFRIMRQLTGFQWLEHDESGYRLGVRSMALSARSHSHAMLTSAARPEMEHLQAQTGVCVNLGVLEGSSVHFVGKVGGAIAHKIPSSVGARVAVHRTLVGRALLAPLSPERVEQVMSLRDRRPDPSLDLPDFHRKLAHVRHRNGLAVLTCRVMNGLAAGIASPDGLVAGMSVVSRERFDLDRTAPLLIDAVRAVSHRMFGPAA
ncbi:helix-turn-helix domain-containing protein [Nocardioides sp. W7]|uniref:IclR family transcriptional regulator n=1 Tax=Nocardioides sp. W7 TaxID=2931390 RepID=UPI001FD02FAC|nr:helix-turn-helix domain-containing protein [Nocardioides sp. W7]